MFDITSDALADITKRIVLSDVNQEWLLNSCLDNNEDYNKVARDMSQRFGYMMTGNQAKEIVVHIFGC